MDITEINPNELHGRRYKKYLDKLRKHIDREGRLVETKNSGSFILFKPEDNYKRYLGTVPVYKGFLKKRITNVYVAFVGVDDSIMYYDFPQRANY